MEWGLLSPFFLDTYSAKLFAANYDTIRPHSIRITIFETVGIFMDLEFFMGPRFLATGHFDMKVYQKDMNSYLYIPPFSAHTKINYSAVILSELQRYCIFCTTTEDYLTLKQLYYDRLLSRGYTPPDLFDLFTTLLDRQTLRDKSNNKRINNDMMPPIFIIR